jgi:WhiB family redox-sensing transcriptional regulator
VIPNRDRGVSIRHALRVERDRGEPRPLLDGVAAPPPFLDGRELCAQADPETWFPEKGGSTREAKAICHRCPLEDECLAWALEHNERFGVWGGTSERERRDLTARRAS